MDKKQLSETLRIDLMPGATPTTPTTPAAHRPPAQASALRARPIRHEEPASVARSRYQELLQSVYDAAILTNVHGRVTDANARAVEFFQCSRDDLCAKNIQDVINGAGERLIETLCEALRNERFILIQAYCQRRDGSFFPAEIAVNMLHFGQIYLCFFIRDITWRKHVEERLRIEHEALQHAATGILIADADMTVEYANPAFARAIGNRAAEALEGLSLLELSSDAEAIHLVVAAISGADTPWHGSVRLRTDAGPVEFRACATCCRDPDGERFGFILSLEAPGDASPEAERIRELEAEVARLRAALTDGNRAAADNG